MKKRLEVFNNGNTLILILSYGRSNSRWGYKVQSRYQSRNFGFVLNKKVNKKVNEDCFKNGKREFF